MTMSAVGKLEEEALKRKERLENLKKKKFKSFEKGEKVAEKESIPKPVFRNYKTDGEAPSTVEDAVKILPDMLPEIQNQLDLMKTPMEVNDIDISNLAPRKVDWDLKRDINKKLQKLERRTQKAITELIRERLQEKNQENILLSVNVAADEQMQNIEEID